MFLPGKLQRGVWPHYQVLKYFKMHQGDATAFHGRPNESRQAFFRKYSSDFIPYVTFTILLMVLAMDFMQRSICQVVVRSRQTYDQLSLCAEG